MQQKRTASLPIFNRGKRPRQALLSHPNNGDGVGGSQQQDQPRQDVRWNSPCGRSDQKSYYNGQCNKLSTASVRAQATPGRKTSGSYSNSFQASKENFQTAPPAGYRPPQTTTSSNFSHAPAYGGNVQQSSYTGRAPHSQPSTSNARHGGFIPYVPANKGPFNQPSTLPMASHSAKSSQHTESTRASFPPGRATEPAQHHTAKMEPSSQPHRVAVQRLGHLPRVITATARGVGHWSKFKAQIPMLFEVTGVLNSAVVAGPLGSKEFSLQAGDGALRCLYWEIDTTLPHLVRGNPIRVVGGWDDNKEWLKCHSVREASQEEVRTAKELVAVCDAAMRQTAATMPEM